jgi:hypothetical protein
MEAAAGSAFVFLLILFVPFVILLFASMAGTKKDREAGIDPEMNGDSNQ